MNLKGEAMAKSMDGALSQEPVQNAFEGIVGNSDKMQSIFRLVERVADSDSTIIINGETGTGKGMIAHAIHKQSYRRNKPFISINCGAIPLDKYNHSGHNHQPATHTIYIKRNSHTMRRIRT